MGIMGLPCSRQLVDPQFWIPVCTPTLLDQHCVHVTNIDSLMVKCTSYQMAGPHITKKSLYTLLDMLILCDQILHGNLSSAKEGLYCLDRELVWNYSAIVLGTCGWSVEYSSSCVNVSLQL